MFVCSRGLSKSWMCGVLAIAVANLWPRSEIIITSSTVAQGNKMAEKILNEIIKRNSPVLLYMYEKEYWVKTQRDDGWTFENKLNGSTIRVLPALDSSRGSRATMLIYEEARLIKFGIIQSVFRPMSHPRQAQYLTNPKYGRDERWLEDTKTVYLSSASYTFEWLYREWKRHVTDMYNHPETKTNVFAGDIFTSIDNGLKTIGDYNKAKKSSTEESFAMEDLNQFIGEASDAFFTYKQFKENQTISQCFRPPTALQFFAGEQPDFPPKKDDEVRLVVVDYAFSNTTGCTKNDNTIITLMSAHWDNKKNRFERHVDYIEGHDASDTIGASDRARYLWWVYNGDYLCPDGRSGGEVLFNHMTEMLPWPELGYRWNPHGLGLADKYQIVPQAKIDDYRSRVVDKDAVPAIIPLIGTPELNSNGWLSLRKQLETNNIKFLISMQDYQNELTESGEYYNYTAEELADLLEPYGQTDMTVIEAVNLKTVIKQDKIKLEEPRNGTKDRIVTIMYGNYVIDLIENAWQQQMQEDEFDMDDIQLVF